MIHFKAGVVIKHYSPALKHILDHLYNLNMMKIPNYPHTWTVTSINDSVHMKGSKHYTDQALDLRSKNFGSEMLKVEFANRLQFSLGIKFTVLYENAGSPNEHFHIQVKKGQVYP